MDPTNTKTTSQNTNITTQNYSKKNIIFLNNPNIAQLKQDNSFCFERDLTLMFKQQ